MLEFNADRCRNWLEDRLKLKMHPETVFIGQEIGGKLVAVVGFSHYVPDTDIEISVASESRGSARAILRAAFQYVFGQSNCLRCTVRIPADNEASIRLATRLGFQMEGRLRRGFRNRDALLFGLIRDEKLWPLPVPLPAHPIPAP